MKKILPVILIMVFVLVSAVYADAPYQISLELKDNASSYSTSVIVNSGSQISIHLGETDVILSVEEKQDGALNFSFDKALQYADKKYGIAELQHFLQPENEKIEFTEPGKDYPVLSISWEQLTLYPEYDKIIEQVTALLKGNQNVEGDFSFIFRLLSGDEDAKNSGFYVIDLDNDGTPELLFGENQPAADSTVFYDMYTIKDSELVHVFDGWDRSRYYLTNNGGIAHEGSSSAFESFTSLNYYMDGELRLMESVIYNSNADPENPWHISKTSEMEISDSDEKVTEDEARYILALYPFVKVELDPFIK